MVIVHADVLSVLRPCLPTPYTPPPGVEGFGYHMHTLEMFKSRDLIHTQQTQ